MNPMKTNPYISLLMLLGISVLLLLIIIAILPKGPETDLQQAISDQVGMASVSGKVVVDMASPNDESPFVSITIPHDNSIVSGTHLIVRGTASDNVGVSRVMVRVNQGEWQVADGTTDWSAPVIFYADSDTIRAQAFDTSGHASPLDAVTVTVQ